FDGSWKELSSTVSQNVHRPSVCVSCQTGTGQNLYLEQNNIPVPEFGGIAVVAISALATSVYILKRKRK
ncbi:MAG TPA: hypothetical protein VEI80_04340, partial [Candidatus Acidoferrales bacterium]|nr:hypothetical protein [Candidatus Acidoferrales bacterium]